MGRSFGPCFITDFLYCIFWVENAKFDFYLRKMGFWCSFYKIEVQVVTNWSTRLLKILHFLLDFSNSSVAHAKIVKRTLFRLNTVYQTQ